MDGPTTVPCIIAPLIEKTKQIHDLNYMVRLWQHTGAQITTPWSVVVQGGRGEKGFHIMGAGPVGIVAPLLGLCRCSRVVLLRLGHLRLLLPYPRPQPVRIKQHHLLRASRVPCKHQGTVDGL